MDVLRYLNNGFIREETIEERRIKNKEFLEKEMKKIEERNKRHDIESKKTRIRLYIIGALWFIQLSIQVIPNVDRNIKIIVEVLFVIGMCLTTFYKNDIL